MKYMNHSKRVPLSTSGFQSCVDGVGMESCNGINGNLLHMLKLLELSHVVADWWHPVASQGSFTKPDFIRKDCSAVNFFWGRHSMNKLTLTTVCSECFLSYSTSLHTGICLAPQRSGLSHFHQEWSWLIMNNVGYRLVWGYTIVSTDSKIKLFCNFGNDWGYSFVSTGFWCKLFFFFLVLNCFKLFFVYDN